MFSMFGLRMQKARVLTFYQNNREEATNVKALNRELHLNHKSPPKLVENMHACADTHTSTYMQLLQ